MPMMVTMPLARRSRSSTLGHSPVRPQAASDSNARASSAPEIKASAAPLTILLAASTGSTHADGTGTTTSRSISTTIKAAPATTSRRRPMRSASAPDGTSSSTIAAAQMALSNANSSTVIP